MPKAPITRVRTIGRLHATLATNDDLVSTEAFDRNGEISDFEICELEIRGFAEIKRDSKIRETSPRRDCPVCDPDKRLPRATKIVTDSDAEIESITIQYVQEYSPFYRDTRFLVPVSHEITTCLECGGAGDLVCSDCNGSGKENCRRCKGTGRREQKKQCETCDGAGNPNCSQCDGAGTVFVLEDCRSCYGEGAETCPTCSGRGSQRCAECKGGGEEHQYNGYSRQITATWVIDGLPTFWETDDHVSLGETVSELEWENDVFELTFKNNSFVNVFAPAAQAGALNIEYGTTEYHAMLVDNGKTRKLIFDPETGPPKTSIKRRFHDLRSRLRQWLF